MKEQIIITNLTTMGVSIKKQKISTMDNVEYMLGLPTRKAYANSKKDRENLKEDVPIEYYNAILEVWGDTPIMEDFPTS